MIEAKDLRIGNWIYLQTPNTLPDFHKVQAEDILTIHNSKALEGYTSPIPLTPEILVKCGFEPWMDVDENEMMRHEEFSIEWMEFLSLDSGYYFNWQSPKETKVTYLHELQNLYYALTGEELEFKP